MSTHPPRWTCAVCGKSAPLLPDGKPYGAWRKTSVGTYCIRHYDFAKVAEPPVELGDLSLKSRTYSRLWFAGVRTVGDLLTRTRESLLAYRSVGAGIVDEARLEVRRWTCHIAVCRCGCGGIVWGSWDATPDQLEAKRAEGYQVVATMTPSWKREDWGCNEQNGSH